jgi:hypothetical protein
MMREYTVVNISQCDGLPARVLMPSDVKSRHRDQRDPTVDAFLACSGADIREDFGEAYFRLGDDFPACRGSRRSNPLRISTAWRFMSWGTGRGTGRGLTAIYGRASASAPMRRRNWSPNCARHSS